MTIPEQKGRPAWEPAVVALFLVVLLLGDGQDLVRTLQGRMAATAAARGWLELGVAAMLAWGLLTSLYRALTWRPRAGGPAAD